LELYVDDDPIRAVAAVLAGAARARETIVLTGGSTAGGAYELAAALEPNWRQASVWWGDERCVRTEDPRSNYGLARRTLLDRLAHRPAEHRIRGELPPVEAAAAYAAELEGVSLDLVLLGLGPDGHIASLFPGSPQLAVRDTLVTSGPAGLEPWVDRVTLTVPALLAARRIVVLATGDEKADAAARAFGGPIGEDVPGSLLRSGSATLEVHLDAAAARHLAHL
jgi:6-phosphogluconolactonase